MSRPAPLARSLAFLLILLLGLTILPFFAAAEPDQAETGAAEEKDEGQTDCLPGEHDEEASMEEAVRNSGAIHAELSPGVRNMVKRAYQLTDIAWIPAKTIEGWMNREENRFLAGHLYTGIPYAQPHRSGSYVPWQTDLIEYLCQVDDPNSRMYTDRAVSQIQRNPGPYFSCECSAFVSWAWGLPQRETTHTLPQYSTVIGSSLSKLQVGDCMNQEGKHARLVTDITYDTNGEITGVEIAEERQPAARRFWFREGSSTHPLSELKRELQENNYVILRCKTRDRIGYTHSCAVRLPGDVCPDCGANPFRDLRLDKWYSASVAYMCNQGLMSGTSADTFSPNEVITRAMAVTMLWRMEHSPDSVGTVPFTDIKTDAYYYSALRWAWTRGIVSGTAPGKFSPKAPCTRAQLVTLLWQSAGKPAPRQSACPFRDVKPGAWYYKALLWALENNIVAGKTSDTFAPKAKATRAETAVMFRAVCLLRGVFDGR